MIDYSEVLMRECSDTQRCTLELVTNIYRGADAPPRGYPTSMPMWCVSRSSETHEREEILFVRAGMIKLHATDPEQYETFDRCMRKKCSDIDDVYAVITILDAIGAYVDEMLDE